MRQEVVGAAPEHEHLSVGAGARRVPQPGALRVAMSERLPLVPAHTVEPSVAWKTRERHTSARRPRRRHPPPPNPPRRTVKLTERLSLRGETSEQEDVIRRHRGEGVPGSAHRTVLRNAPAALRSPFYHIKTNLPSVFLN